MFPLELGAGICCNEREFDSGMGCEVGGGDGMGIIILQRPLPEPLINELVIWQKIEMDHLSL